MRSPDAWEKWKITIPPIHFQTTLPWAGKQSLQLHCTAKCSRRKSVTDKNEMPPIKSESAFAYTCQSLVQIRRVRGWFTPWKRAFTRKLGFLSVHLRVKFLSKGVKYAHIKISARTFHSWVSFAHKNRCTLATLFNSACVTYINSWLLYSRFVSYCMLICF